MWRRDQHDPKAEALLQLEVWSGIRWEDAETIARVADELSLPAGARLCRDRSPAHEVFLVLEGTAVARHDGEVLGRCGPGTFVGEMGVIDGELRSAEVEAETDVRVLVFSAPAFRGLIDTVPGLTRRAMAEMVGRIRDRQPASASNSSS